MKKPFDLILFGATGFTGRQTFLHLLRHAPADMRWAIGGRNRAKLQAMLDEVPGAANPPDIVMADSANAASVDALVAQTQVILQLAGPYSKHGDAFVESCIRHGTDYIDLTGEIFWVKQLVERFHADAAEKKVRIVPVCGYEALPFDLGALLAAKELVRRHKEKAASVDIVCTLSGMASTRPADMISGGTIETVKIMLRTETGNVLGDPACLVQDRQRRARIRKASPYNLSARYEPRVGAWVGPTVPAPFINVPVLYRTAALLAEGASAANPFSSDFRYAEAMSMASFVPLKPMQRLMAEATAIGFRGMLLATESKGRLARQQKLASAKFLDWFAPSPGEGPTDKALERSGYRLDIYATSEGGHQVHGVCTGRGHPGYRSTATLVAEVSMALALGRGKLPRLYGIITPATALGSTALKALERGGLSYRFD